MQLIIATHWNNWLWFWLAFVVILLLMPLAYGWSYRGYGPPPMPYRRRASAADPTRAEDPETQRVAAEEEEAWGALGVALWLVLAIALMWLIVALIF